MDDETREWLHQLFAKAQADAPPPDVVPYEKASPAEMRAHYLRMNEIAGTWVRITIPGEVILDADGMPIGVEESRTELSHHGGAGVTRRELEAAGLTPEDVPKLTVVDLGPRREEGR